MDKVEYRELIRSIKNKYLQNDYEGVIAVSEQLDIEKIKENSILEIIAKAYECLNRCDLAKETLMIAYKRMPAGKRIAYNLAMLCIELDDLDSAVMYYEDFCKLAPKDNQRLLLKYQIGRAGGVSVRNLAHVLEKYVSREMDDRWQYELATLYHEIGDDEKCAAACDQIILWYANGEYEKKALELKSMHKSLTSAQQARYDEIMQNAVYEEAAEEAYEPEDMNPLEAGDNLPEAEETAAEITEIEAASGETAEIETVEAGAESAEGETGEAAAEITEIEAASGETAEIETVEAEEGTAIETREAAAESIESENTESETTEAEVKLPEIDYHTKHLGSQETSSDEEAGDDDNISGQMSLTSMFEAFKNQTKEEREQMNQLGADRAARILAEVNGTHDSSALEQFKDDVYDTEDEETYGSDAETASADAEENFEEVIEPEVPLLNREDEIVPVDDGGEDLWERKPEFAFEKEAKANSEKESAKKDYAEAEAEAADENAQEEEIAEISSEEEKSGELPEEKAPVHNIEQSIDATQFIPVAEIAKLAAMGTDESDFYTDIKPVGEDAAAGSPEGEFEPGRELTDAEKAIIAYETSKMLNKDNTETPGDVDMTELLGEVAETVTDTTPERNAAEDSVNNDGAEEAEVSDQEYDKPEDAEDVFSQDVMSDNDDNIFDGEAEYAEDAILGMGREKTKSGKAGIKDTLLGFFKKNKKKSADEDEHEDEFEDEIEGDVSSQEELVSEAGIKDDDDTDVVEEADSTETAHEEAAPAEAETVADTETDADGKEELTDDNELPPLDGGADDYDDDYDDEADYEDDEKPVKKSVFSWFKRKKKAAAAVETDYQEDDEIPEEEISDSVEKAEIHAEAEAEAASEAEIPVKAESSEAEIQAEAEAASEAEIQVEAESAATEIQAKAEVNTAESESVEAAIPVEAEGETSAPEAAEAVSEDGEAENAVSEAAADTGADEGMSAAVAAALAEAAIAEAAAAGKKAEAVSDDTESGESDSVKASISKLKMKAQKKAEAAEATEAAEAVNEDNNKPTAREIKKAEKLEKKKAKALKKQNEKELDKRIKKELAEQKAHDKKLEKALAKQKAKELAKENPVQKQRPERRRMEVEANAKKFEKEKARLAANKPVIDPDIIEAVDAATNGTPVTRVIPVPVSVPEKSFSLNDFVKTDKPVTSDTDKSGEFDINAFIKPDKSVVPEFISKKQGAPEFDLDSFIDAGKDTDKKKAAPAKAKAKESFDVNDFINASGSKKNPEKAKNGSKVKADNKAKENGTHRVTPFEAMVAERKKNQMGLQKLTKSAEKAKQPAVVPTKKVVYNKKYELSKQQRKDLAEFLLIDGMEEAICSTIEKLIIKKKSGDETGGHLIITGDKKTGKTYLVIEIIKAVNKEVGHGNPRVAKVQSQAINGKNIKKILSKVTDSDLVIENIGKLEDDTIRDLISAVRESNAPTMVILEGNELAADTMIQNFPDIGKIFKTRIDIGELTLTQWADLAKKYASGQGYSISDMAQLALHAKIDEINTPDVRLGFKQVQKVVDDAIERAEKRNSAKLFSAFTKKNDSLIPLEENDFM